MTPAVALLEPSYSPPAPTEPAQQRGAYAVAHDDQGRVLVVQTQSGRFYLPGGRIEPGENPIEALAREIHEECGYGSEVGAPIYATEQPIFGGTVRLNATYWAARLTDAAGTRPEHRMMWLRPAEAASCLHRAGDRQAIAFTLR